MLGSIGYRGGASADIPGFTNGDRLGLTAFASILAHMVVILGISFTTPESESQTDPLPTLEITLVNTRSETEPDRADFLAQANQDGGGDSERPVMAKSPLPLRPSPMVSDHPPVAQVASKAVSETAQQTRLLTQNRDESLIVARIDPQSPSREQHNHTRPGLVPDPARRQESARLSAEIDQFWERYQKRPRRKFISARTKEYKYATYMEAWRAKVERIGNLNYPEQAKRRRLNGQLVLDVEVKADGNLHAISIIRPSGHKILDDAAVRIVEMSAPFEPFPALIREETDILHITRTWQFVRGDTLTSH